MAKATKTIVEYRNIADIKPNPKNPRVIKDEKYAQLVHSLRNFPDMLEKRPLVCFTDIDGKLVVLGGNMRLKAAIEIGLKELPVMLADDWTEEQKAEFIIKDNVSFGEWNRQELHAGWDVQQLAEWGLDIPDFDNEIENNYSRKIEAPIYTPISDKIPELSVLYNTEKYKSLILKIEQTDIHISIKDFLKVAATRHIVFNYSNIAEFYSHVNKELQELMEDSALVIIDFNKAIENGYVKLTEEIINAYSIDYNE